ncbi:MAG: WecB/TagA/CpsF family glycosyltransferase [Pseudomonadales bacterium]|nr:WecB/TagA/CpsF family glycosyltransferase [Pseudomonadales bacterium]
MKNSDLTTNLFDYHIYCRDRSSLLKYLYDHLKKSDGLISIFTPNPEQIVLSKKQKSFAKNLGFADISIPDGIGLVFASKILAFLDKGEEIKERITGIDLSKSLLNYSKDSKYSILIIGGKDYLGRKFDEWEVRKSSSSNPNIQSTLKMNSQDSLNPNIQKSNLISKKRHVIWWTEGYESVSDPTIGETNSILTSIATVKPKIVFVAFGAPYQEEWVVENSDFLKKNKVNLVMVVGGTFDVLLGKVSRAPEWIQKLGLEWFYRLLGQPWRWRRQMKLLEFVGLVVKKTFFV